MDNLQHNHDWRQRETISVQEAAAILGISRSSAFAAVKSGEIPTFRVGRRVLVSTSRLARLLDGTY